jgi:hypothetical protein
MSRITKRTRWHRQVILGSGLRAFGARTAKNAEHGTNLSSRCQNTFNDTNGGYVGSLGFKLKKANKGNNMNKIYVGLAVYGLRKRFSEAMTKLHHWALLRGIR